jgi:hypothetical protein
MAWTTPRTWSTGETVTAAIMNAHVRDNLNFLYGAPACRAYHNAAQATTTAVALALALNSERFDNDTMHDTSSNNSRITFTTAGRYVVTGSIEFASNATGVRTCQIRLGGATVIAGVNDVDVAASLCVLPVATVYSFSAAEYVELVATQTSGGNLNVNSSTNYSPEFSAHWLGN